MKNLFKAILAVGFGLALALIILEVSLRLFQPLEFRVKGDKLNLPINKNYVFAGLIEGGMDKVIVHHKNSLGFRGEEAPRNFREYLTLVAVGGSTTECVFISDGKTWVDILGQHLKDRFQRLWINNAGLDGQSTFGHLILMQDYLIELKPKVCLFLVGANDQCLSNEGTKFDKKLAEKEEQDASKSAKSYFFQREMLNSSINIFLNFLNKSEILNYATNIWRFFKAKKMGVNHQIFDLTTAASQYMPPERASHLLQQHRETYLNPYRLRLLRLIKICREHDIEPVFLTQPSLKGEGKDPVTGVDLGKLYMGGFDGKTEWGILELYNDVLRLVARENKVTLIDLGRELPKSSAYFYDSYHFTNMGSEKVADIVLAHLSPFLTDRFPEYHRPGQQQ